MASNKQKWNAICEIKYENANNYDPSSFNSIERGSLVWLYDAVETFKCHGN